MMIGMICCILFVEKHGSDTTSMISSPVLLGEIEKPEDTVFIVTGVEQDTISLPRFTGDADVIQFSESEGYYNRD